jgi:hypothetical protein
MERIHITYFNSFGNNKEYNETKNTENQEIEVYRNSLNPDKYYFTALLTREVGNWNNKQFFTTNKPIYAGKYMHQVREG